MSPLLNASSEEREKHAVDSEHQKNLQSDVWRLQQLLHTTSNPKHPFHKFGTGNLKTLNPQVGLNRTVVEELRQFQHKYYTANLMRLVVYGRDDVAQLEAWVRQMFSDVPNHNEEVPSWKEIPVRTKEQLGLVYRVVPIKETRQVRLVWLLPSMVPHYRKKSLEYVMALLGGEGIGSIFAQLRKKGWLEGITTGNLEEGSGFGFFETKCILTKEGFAHVNQVVATVYQYIELLRCVFGCGCVLGMCVRACVNACVYMAMHVPTR